MRVEPVPYAGREAQDLIARVQQEYVRRYGGPDATPVDPSEFLPPGGLFLLARDADGGAVGCGGWRAHPAERRRTLSRGGASVRAAEIKRMYVVPERRRQGIAQAILGELERTAAAAGYRCVELFTGLAQPEAIAMYVAAGYTAVAGFGPYRHERDARYFGKRLVAAAGVDGAGILDHESPDRPACGSDRPER